MDDKVKHFWNAQAAIHGPDSRATAPDVYYRDMEINRIMEELPDKGHVLDVGCGNGYSTFAFAACLPEVNFLGVDYSEKMIEQAESAYKLPNLKFEVMDVRHPFIDAGYDAVVSERCVINLSSWDEQKESILRMRNALKRGGKLILVENTIEGLDRLNDIRSQFNLDEIKVRWHNKYLPESDLIRFLMDNFSLEVRKNIGGLYYIISRVIYAAMAKEDGEEPQYNHPLNRLAARLPYIPCECSPNYLFVARKR